MLVRTVGRDNAVAFGNAHEATLWNPLAERLMDQYNNVWGRYIGLRYAWEKGRSLADSVRIRCLAAVESHVLVRLVDK